MSTRITWFCVLTVCVVAASGCGCSGRLPDVEPVRINASSAKAEAMRQYDTNSDGRIEGEELENAPWLKNAMERGKRLDVNGDGAITETEIADRIRIWMGSDAGRWSMLCQVKQGGQPLVGATVKFVPPAFLGDKMPTATGVTDEQGTATISIPRTGEDDPDGVPPGLYRMEVTKEGVDIPEKYNTRTEYGIEVAVDAGGLGGDLSIEIK